MLKLYREPVNLVGKSFNDLRVTRKTTERQSGHVIYECECICGRKTRVRATRLTNNITKSCGRCLWKASTVNATIPFQGEDRNG